MGFMNETIERNNKSYKSIGGYRKLNKISIQALISSFDKFF